MSSVFLVERGKWPFLICGPMLRRVTPKQVAVFVAACLPFQAILKIRQVGTGSSAWLASTPQSSLKLGEYLYTLVVSWPGEQSPQSRLQAGATYEYDLDFTTIQPGSIPNRDDGTPVANYTPSGPLTFTLNELGLLNNPAQGSGQSPQPSRRIGLTEGELPTFVVEPQRRNLGIVHASCRKPHGGGLDVLPAIEALLTGPLSGRPSYLILTGDQIYADDVSTSLLWTLQQTGQALMGATAESLLMQEGAVTILNSIAGQARRTLLAKDTKVTSGEKDSHLLFLAEFYAMYLFVWSPALWGPGWRPDTPPTESEWAAVAGPAGWPKNSRSQHSVVATFSHSTPAVRRVLANIPTLMMFDDHEVTDDWNLNFDWNRASRTESPLLHRIVRNGLLAYGVFQAWGNDPDQYATQTTGRTLLESLVPVPSSTSTSNPTVFNAPACVDDLLQLTPVGSTTTRGPMLWHWGIDEETYDYRILALDTRTRRDYRGFSETGLLTSEAMTAQLPTPPPGDTRLTYVLSPAPVFGHPLMEEIIQPLAREYGQAAYVDAEAWSLNRASLVNLMYQLALYRCVVLLSGDVHYGFTNKTEFVAWDALSSSPRTAVIAQLCASALHNQEALTLAIEAAALAGLYQRAWRGREFAQWADHVVGGKSLAELMDDAINDSPANWVAATGPVQLSLNRFDDVVAAVVGKSMTSTKLIVRVVRKNSAAGALVSALVQGPVPRILAFMYFRAIRADVPSVPVPPGWSLTVPVGPWFRAGLRTAVDRMFPVPTSPPSQRTWTWSTTFIEAAKMSVVAKGPYSRGATAKRLMVVGRPHFGEVRVNSAQNSSKESLTHILHLMEPSGTPSVVTHQIPSLTPPSPSRTWTAVY